MSAVEPTRDSLLDTPIATIIVVILVLIGGADLIIDGSLSGDFKTYVETVAWIVGPLAVGRGLAARKAG
jgi:hypothetical protein